MRSNPVVFFLDGSAGEVLRGLTASQKWLPAKLFYDAAGSALFEKITELPEYYLTSTEEGIFERSARQMVECAGGASTIVELGAGTAKKSVLILRAALELHREVRFIPVDVSSSAMEIAKKRVSAELPEVEVQPLVLDYTQRSRVLAEIGGRKLVLFIGSSIGNFEPMAASALLGRLRSSLNDGDSLLLGTDMRKPADVLMAAYDDAYGITAQFNRNILTHINREYGGNFDVHRFEHRVRWNERESRIEMHLESLEDQLVKIAALNLSVAFGRGETIHTENSYKFTEAMIEGSAWNAGLSIEQQWSDERGWFTVSLLRVNGNGARHGD
jgi:dimethylhistidine N-methyltransferase